MWQLGKLVSPNLKPPITQERMKIRPHSTQFKLIKSQHRMLVTSVSTNIIPLMESFSAYPKWISLAIRIFNTSSGGASVGMFDILVWFFVSPQTYIENYTPYLHKYTFRIREIKQIRTPHIRTLARSHHRSSSIGSHWQKLCARIPMLDPCTANSTDHVWR